jgi:hypothetical protein
VVPSLHTTAPPPLEGVELADAGAAAAAALAEPPLAEADLFTPP